MLDVPHVRLRLRDTTTPRISNFYTYPSLVVRITFTSSSNVKTVPYVITTVACHTIASYKKMKSTHSLPVGAFSGLVHI